MNNKSFDFEGMRASYAEGGVGMPLLLIHGSGPGASTIGNWRKILEPLMERYHVYAMDLIGFGTSGRRPVEPYFDMTMWLRQCRALIGMIPGATLGVIGHSLSGALALKLAAVEPRIEAVLTTASMGAHFTRNQATDRVWTFPEDMAAFEKLARSIIFDTSQIDDAYLAARKAILFDDPSYGAYFRSMFGADKQAFIDAALLTPDELSKISCRVTMLHGRDDVPFPPGITMTIAESLKQADVNLIARCSHSIAMEHPDKVLAAAHLLFG